MIWRREMGPFGKFMQTSEETDELDATDEPRECKGLGTTKASEASKALLPGRPRSGEATKLPQPSEESKGSEALKTVDFAEGSEAPEEPAAVETLRVEKSQEAPDVPEAARALTAPLSLGATEVSPRAVRFLKLLEALKEFEPTMGPELGPR